MKKISTLLLVITATFAKPAVIHAQTVNVNDSLALVDLYNSTNGQLWTNNRGWLVGPVPSWNGITVNGDGRVTGSVI